MPGLITEGPNDDRWVVLISLDHALHAIEMSREPAHFVANLSFFVNCERMRLYIGLVNDIKTVFIGEVIPARVIGVVARPHRIDVVLLH